MKKSDMPLISTRIPQEQTRELRSRLAMDGLSCQSLLQGAVELYLNGDSTVALRARIVEQESK
jgi:hypothetical protein